MRNLEETFTYDNQNRLTGVWLGPHAMDAATTAEGVFPATPQAVTYTGFDKVGKVKQGSDSLCYAYGYDRQRILMEEHVCGLTRTKQYWGACEYVTESDGSNTSSLWRTFVAGPYGVFAVVETRSAMDEIHYVLKDNLGSWTTITDGNGTVEQRLSYDAWGNLRDPNTWANYTVGDSFAKPMFDRGYTGHEHLYDFGLINMNGRMYDPVVSSFLSVDQYVQSPESAQGFNRYAYCMNNPLRYVDPTGWAPRPGGSGPSIPPPYVVIDGWGGHLLNEVTITDSFYEEFEYTPYYCTGGSNDIVPPWSDAGNVPSIRPSDTGCGGGSGTHGGKTASQTSMYPNSHVDLVTKNIKATNEANSYITSTNTIINKGAVFTKEALNVSKETEAAIVLGKVSKLSKVLGSVGLVVNYGCTIVQVQQNIMPWQEGVVRVGMSTVEFAISGVPYVGPILSIGLTAFDISGGFDDNLYKTENWWR